MLPPAHIRHRTAPRPRASLQGGSGVQRGRGSRTISQVRPAQRTAMFLVSDAPPPHPHPASAAAARTPTPTTRTRQAHAHSHRFAPDTHPRPPRPAETLQCRPRRGRALTPPAQTLHTPQCTPPVTARPGPAHAAAPEQHLICTGGITVPAHLSSLGSYCSVSHRNRLDERRSVKWAPTPGGTMGDDANVALRLVGRDVTPEEVRLLRLTSARRAHVSWPGTFPGSPHAHVGSGFAVQQTQARSRSLTLRD